MFRWTEIKFGIRFKKNAYYHWGKRTGFLFTYFNYFVFKYPFLQKPIWNLHKNEDIKFNEMRMKWKASLVQKVTQFNF